MTDITHDPHIYAGATAAPQFVAGQLQPGDIVMHGGTPNELRIARTGITYRGQALEDAGAVHHALLDVLNGRQLPAIERVERAPIGDSIDLDTLEKGWKHAHANGLVPPANPGIVLQLIALARHATANNTALSELLRALRDGIPLNEPVYIGKALLAQREARVSLSGGIGPVACAMLVNIQLTAWKEGPESAEAFVKGYNTALDHYRSALCDLASNAAAVAQGEHMEREDFQTKMRAEGVENFTRRPSGRYDNMVLEWHWLGWRARARVGALL